LDNPDEPEVAKFVSFAGSKSLDYSKWGADTDCFSDELSQINLEGRELSVHANYLCDICK